MGTLKPDAKYVYESPDGGHTVYAREVGSTDRRLVGYSYDALEKKKQEEQQQLWQDILRASKNNEALKKALDHAILIYNLTKEHNELLHIRV